MENRRKLKRYKISLPIIFNDNFDGSKKFKGEIIDINLQGARIFSPEQYTKGSKITLTMSFKNGKKFYSILGEIRYQNKTDKGYNLGIQIINYNVYHLKHLVDVIETLGPPLSNSAK